VHAFRLGKAARMVYQALDPRAPVNALTLDLPRLSLPDSVLSLPPHPFVGTPADGGTSIVLSGSERVADPQV
jgi:hypothetical protein